MRRLVGACILVACALGGPAGAGAGCGRDSAPWRVDPSPALATVADASLRVATYNIHSGLGARFALGATRARVEANLRAIADDVAGAFGDAPADVVGLNEVDFASRRSAWIDEAAFLARALERRTGARYAIVRGETWRRDVPGLEVRFGNAVLVRHPILRADACLFDDLDACAAWSADAPLPSLHASGWLARLAREPRGVIRLTTEIDGRTVDVVVTHLDAFAMAEREAQAAHLLRRLVEPGRPTVVLGDMNAVPFVMTRLRRFFRDDRTHDLLGAGVLADTRLVYAAMHDVATLADWATFPAAAPSWPLDWALATPELAPLAIRTIGGAASDHRGLVVAYGLVTDPAMLAGHRALCEGIRTALESCAPAVPGRAVTASASAPAG
jgi:endonuclease/exonuclease/phosphatase family metal-dependent hydrolase